MNRRDHKRVSLVEVAALADVSTATASRILNGNGPFAEGTRARVLEAARKTHYIQNPYFRRIRRNDRPASTGSLAMLLPSFYSALHRTDQQTNRVLAGVECAAQNQRYHLIVSTVEEKDGLMPRVMADGNVDGVILAGGHSAEMIDRIQAVIPTVVVNDRISGAGVSCIAVDDAAAVRAALDHLRSLGHRQIVFFYIADFRYAGDVKRGHEHPHVLRANAFKLLAMDGGMPGARIERLPVRTKPLVETVADCLLAWRESGTMPTALLCAADVYAMAFLHAAADLGIPVPGGLSVIGIDDDSACEHVRPNLTSIRAPLEEMGTAAVETLINRLEHPGAAGMSQFFDVKLIARKSCAPLSPQAAFQTGKD
jgi:DNA-binding LacI/PurR family transcriptional regulator